MNKEYAPKELFKDSTKTSLIDTTNNGIVSKRVFRFNEANEFFEVYTEYNKSGISNSSQVISFFSKKLGKPKVTNVDSTMSADGMIIKIKGKEYEWNNKGVQAKLDNLSFIIPESTKKAYIDMMKSNPEIQMLLMGMQMESGVSASQMNIFLEQMMMQQFSQIQEATLSSTVTSTNHKKTTEKPANNNFF